MKHIVCFSKGHSSALVAIEVVKKYGKENVILLNHNISSNVENEDIKRFGDQVSNYLGIPITYANYKNIQDEKLLPDQFDIAIFHKGFKVPSTDSALCTDRLKTGPFMDYLSKFFSRQDCIIYYGFDKKEIKRKARREFVMGLKGYDTEYPLIDWPLTINSTLEIGIHPPSTYGDFKHANCTGCLKGGLQHWYCVYCKRIDIYQKAANTERTLNYSILKRKKLGVWYNTYLDELALIFERMKEYGVPQREHYSASEFKKDLKRFDLEEGLISKPCECVF